MADTYVSAKRVGKMNGGHLHATEKANDGLELFISHGAAPVINCGLWDSQFNAGMPCRQIAEVEL